jgi:4a-hydroxytetrahydrobiopterin dehydratase
MPCREGDSPLTRQEAAEFAEEIPKWRRGEKSLEREFKFRNFREALDFINEVADAAEEEGHHPDIHIYYNQVRLELTTHKVGGLTRNDFILAAKIDEIA